MDASQVVLFASGVITGLGAMALSANGQPKTQKGLLLLTVALFAWALIPLPAFVPVLTTALVVPPEYVLATKWVGILIAVVLAWRFVPMQAPRALVTWDVTRGKVMIHVCNAGPTEGEFYASAQIPYLESQKPYVLAWNGKERRVSLAPNESESLWLCEIENGYLVYRTVDKGGQHQEVWVGPPFRDPENRPMPLLKDSPGLVIVTIRTVPEPYRSGRWAWRGQLVVGWDGADGLKIVEAKSAPPRWPWTEAERAHALDDKGRGRGA